MQKVLKQNGVVLSENCVSIEDTPIETEIELDDNTDNDIVDDDIEDEENDEASEAQADDLPIIISEKQEDIEDDTQPKLYRFPTLEEKMDESALPPINKPIPADKKAAHTAKHTEKKDEMYGEMVDKAVKEASRILEEAHIKAQQDYNELMANGKASIDREKEEAKQAGYAEGMRSQIQNVRQTIEQLEMAVATIEGKQEAYLASSEQDLKWLAIEIASSIMHESLQADETKLAKLVKDAIASQRSAKWLTVEVSGATGALLEKLNEQLCDSDPDRIKLKAVQSAPEGTCIIKMPDGFIDASIYTQIENLKQYFSADTCD